MKAAPIIKKNYNTMLNNKLKKNDVFKIQDVNRSDFSVRVTFAEKNVTETMGNQSGKVVFDVEGVVKYKCQPVDCIETRCMFGRVESGFPEMASNANGHEMDRLLSMGYTYSSIFMEDLLNQYAYATLCSVYGKEYGSHIGQEAVNRRFQELNCVVVPEDGGYRLLFGYDRPSLASRALEKPVFTRYFDMNTAREVYEYDGVFYNDMLERIKVQPYHDLFGLTDGVMYPAGRVVVSNSKKGTYCV